MAEMKLINVAELASWLGDGDRPQPVLLDVREPWEQQICAIPGSLAMPLSQIAARVGAEVDADGPVVCVCHHGNRSARVAMFLLQKGYQDVYNLAGGVDAWARQIDPTMATY